MRMKMRVIYTYLQRVCLLVAVVMLSSACNGDESNDLGAISFGTSTDLVSRAAIYSNGELQEACLNKAQSIGIYGTATTSQTPTPVEVFSNDALYYDGSEWTYDNLRYWAYGAKYDFAAIFPRSTSYTYNSSTGDLSWKNITLSSSNNMDLMYATAQRDLSVSADTSTPVTLPLKHAFALVEFWFVNASDSSVASVTNVALTNVCNQGEFSLSKNGTAKLTVNSTKNSTAYTGNLATTNIPVNVAKQYNLFGNLGSTSGEVYDSDQNVTRVGSGSVVVMPQLLLGANPVKLQMKVSTQSSTSAVTLGVSGGIEEWKAGEKYVYVLTLTSTKITFEVRVLNWIDDEIELEDR